jgi:nucleotide-binding universal stress UspA family protein
MTDCIIKATITLPKRTRYATPARPRFRMLNATGAVKQLQIRKILVPVDFSSASHQAIKFALPLLRRFGAELHLVHVSAPDVPLSGLAAMPIVLTETESADRVRLHLKRAAEKSAAELQTANIHALRGEAFEEICRLTRDIDIDLIVISTRGQTGFKHLLMGSTAERVVRHSPCPVLVLKPGTRERGNGKFSSAKLHFARILVPIDFSDCSKKALNYAKALALQFGSKLVLFNSVALEYYVSNDEYARYDFPKQVRYAEGVARKQMERLVKTTRWNGIEVETSVQIGHAGQQICAHADHADIDLIVTSTHGRTGFKHVLVGSTAEYIVQHAAGPVLVVPAHDRPILTPN